MPHTLSVDDVLALAERLSPAEKAVLIARLADDLATSKAAEPRPSLIGLHADLGLAPSAEEIDAVRREMSEGAK